LRYRKLSTSGDYTWGNSEKDFFVNEPAAVGQAVRTRLLLFQGEWFLDTDEGLPLLEGVIGKHRKSTADQTIQDRVVNTQGLLDIVSYSSTVVSRNFSAVMKINTIYGPLTPAPVILKYSGGFPYLATESGDQLVTESGEPIII